MINGYQIRLETEALGAVKCIYKNLWSVVLGDDEVVLREASAANVAGYLAAILSAPDLLMGLECMLHSVEAVAPF